MVTTVGDTPANNALIDAFSLRNHGIGSASGHYWFFATFARFGAAGNMLGTDTSSIWN